MPHPFYALRRKGGIADTRSAQPHSCAARTIYNLKHAHRSRPIPKAGGFHFLTFSCYRRQPFLDQTNGYDIFEQELESLRIQHLFIIAGYVLMPEHVHLLVNEPADKPLATVLQILKQKTSRRLKSKTEPQFWQRRYCDFNVRTEEKTAEKLRYMHRNQ